MLVLALAVLRVRVLVLVLLLVLALATVRVWVLLLVMAMVVWGMMPGRAAGFGGRHRAVCREKRDLRGPCPARNRPRTSVRLLGALTGARTGDNPWRP